MHTECIGTNLDPVVIAIFPCPPHKSFIWYSPHLALLDHHYIICNNAVLYMSNIQYMYCIGWYYLYFGALMGNVHSYIVYINADGKYIYTCVQRAICLNPKDTFIFIYVQHMHDIRQCNILSG